MAFVNPIKPSGLSLVANLLGASTVGQGRIYAIPSTDSTYNYFPGDLVSRGTGGDVNGLPTISLTAAGTTAVGVIQAIGINPAGFYGDPNNLSRTWAPITKLQTYYALVIDDPNAIFEIQEGGTATNLTTSSVGLNANIALAAASTAAVPGVYVSQTYLNGNTAPTTTSTLNLKILSLAQRIDNHFVTTPATGGGGQKWWVMINNHSYRAGITAP